MKKMTLPFGMLLFVSIALASCSGNTIESDAKKIAELQCRAMQLLGKSMSAGSNYTAVLEESRKVSEEADALVKQMEKKYTSQADKEKLAMSMLKALGECK